MVSKSFYISGDYGKHCKAKVTVKKGKFTKLIQHN